MAAASQAADAESATSSPKTISEREFIEDETLSFCDASIVNFFKALLDSLSKRQQTL